VSPARRSPVRHTVRTRDPKYKVPTYKRGKGHFDVILTERDFNKSLDDGSKGLLDYYQKINPWGAHHPTFMNGRIVFYALDGEGVAERAQGKCAGKIIDVRAPNKKHNRGDIVFALNDGTGHVGFARQQDLALEPNTKARYPYKPTFIRIDSQGVGNPPRVVHS